MKKNLQDLCIFYVHNGNKWMKDSTINVYTGTLVFPNKVSQHKFENKKQFIIDFLGNIFNQKTIKIENQYLIIKESKLWTTNAAWI